jgi:hypothetical protein
MAGKRNLVLTELEEEQAQRLAAAFRAAKGVGADEMARRIAGESPDHDRRLAAQWLERSARLTTEKALKLWPSDPKRDDLLQLAKDMRRDADDIRKGAAFKLSSKDGGKVLTVDMSREGVKGRVIDVDARE